MPHVSPKALLDDVNQFATDNLEGYRPWYHWLCPRNAGVARVVTEVGYFREGKLRLSTLLKRLEPPPDAPEPALSARLESVREYCKEVFQRHPELLFNAIMSGCAIHTIAILDVLQLFPPEEQDIFFRWTTVETQRNVLMQCLRFQKQAFPVLLKAAFTTSQSHIDAHQGSQHHQLISDLLTHSMVYGHRTDAPLLVYAICYHAEHVSIICDVMKHLPNVTAILTQTLYTNSLEIPRGNALWHAAKRLPERLAELLMLMPLEERIQSVRETFGESALCFNFETLDDCKNATQDLHHIALKKPRGVPLKLQFLKPISSLSVSPLEAKEDLTLRA